MTKNSNSNKREIVSNIKEYTQDELADFMEEGVITLEDVFIGTMIEKIWNSDDKEWPRA